MKLRNLALVLMVLAAGALAQPLQVLPQGTQVKVRTDTAIPATPAANAKYTATVSNDILDRSGNVVIPRGSRATLVAVRSDDGKDTNLDLRSVRVNGQRSE